MEVNDYISYKLAKASIYLKKARDILDEVELLNHKVQCDFDSITNFCNYHRVIFKRIDDEDGFKNHYQR